MPGSSLIDRVAAHNLQAYEAEQAAHPYRFVHTVQGPSPSLLFVENVAAMLGCSIDYVRRIPRTELPRSKVGQRVIYSRDDVEKYVAGRRDAGERRYVPERKARPDRSVKAVSNSRVSTFDPVAFVQSLQKGR